MARHPYIDLPDRQFWKRDPGIKNLALFDPVSDGSFQISKEDRIVTAGSCFAQHLAKRLSASGFNHFIAEPAHPLVSPQIAQKHHYGMFSARYGNIYTARQLLQLLQRAFGKFEPRTSAWEGRIDGRWVDPFRPSIEPDEYETVADVEADRDYHLSCVKRAIETMDVFVFTLGLTEGWSDKTDGAVWPLAPGVSGGIFDETESQFENFDVGQTTNDLRQALELIRNYNPDVRIILTVSPVPLNATFVPRHCVVSTVWSKSVLRVAAQTLADTMDHCDYFPSYEVITGPQSRGKFFAKDAREVTDRGVTHVMSLFFRHYTESGLAPQPSFLYAQIHRGKQILRAGYQKLPFGFRHRVAHTRANLHTKRRKVAMSHTEEMEQTFQVLCDEEKIDNK